MQGVAGTALAVGDTRWWWLTQLTGPLCASASVFKKQGGSKRGRRKRGTKFLVDINLLLLGGPRKQGWSDGEVTLLI